MGDIAAWEKFGLPGLVIFALFALVVYLIKHQTAEGAAKRASEAALADAIGTNAKAITGLHEWLRGKLD